MFVDKSFVDDRLHQREKSVWSHDERWSIEAGDISKIRKDLSDIGGASKQQLDITTFIRLARCEISSLKIK